MSVAFAPWVETRKGRVDWVQCLPRHIHSLELLPGCQKLVMADGWNDTDAEMRLFKDARTLMIDGRALAAVGINMPWDHVAEAWSMLSTESIQHHGIKLLRGTQRAIHWAIKTYSLHRVQTYIREDNPVAIQWIEHLGFDLEAKLRRFNADGSNILLYVRLP